MQNNAQWQLLLIITLLLTVFLFSACASQPADSIQNDTEEAADVADTMSEASGEDTTSYQQTTEQASIGESEMWRVELLSADMTDSLITTRAALQYGGGVLETTNEVLPASGHYFLLMGLIVEKIGVGRAAFSWNDAHIIDSEGNVFYRHPNDTFLTHLNIPRLRGTDMVFGSEYGYVCFEIPHGAEGLQFVADEGRIVLDVEFTFTG